jgi:ankyrin repeat protein
MSAVLCGCSAVVASLIKNKADVNSVFEDEHESFTAVSLASEPEIVRMLIDAKANMSPMGCVSPLHTAFVEFQPESVKMLLDAGAARLPYYNLVGESVYHRILHYPCTEATAEAKLATVVLLLNKGTRISDSLPDIAEDPCMERIMDAVLQRRPELLHEVHFGGTGKEKTLLYCAVENKKVRMVKYLVSIGADVNNRNAVSLLPLLISHQQSTSCARSRAILRILTDAGLDLSERDDMGRTAFMNALRGNNGRVSVTFIRDMAEAVLRRGLCVAAAVSRRLVPVPVSPLETSEKSYNRRGKTYEDHMYLQEESSSSDDDVVTVYQVDPEELMKQEQRIRNWHWYKNPDCSRVKPIPTSVVFASKPYPHLDEIKIADIDLSTVTFRIERQ